MFKSKLSLSLRVYEASNIQASAAVIRMDAGMTPNKISLSIVSNEDHPPETPSPTYPMLMRQKRAVRAHLVVTGDRPAPSLMRVERLAPVGAKEMAPTEPVIDRPIGPGLHSENARTELPKPDALKKAPPRHLKAGPDGGSQVGEEGASADSLQCGLPVH